MTDGLIIAMIIAAALAIVAVKMHSLPVIFISSIGWSVAALQVFEQTEEVLPMMLLLMLAFSQFFLIRRETI